MAPDPFEFKLERELHFRIGGDHSTGKLVVGGLRWREDKKRWACHYSLAHVDSGGGEICGEDALAAFVNTLDFLSILIRGSEDDGLVVWWQAEGDHAGLIFPLSEGKKWQEIPPSMR